MSTVKTEPSLQPCGFDRNHKKIRELRLKVVAIEPDGRAALSAFDEFAVNYEVARGVLDTYRQLPICPATR